jgi:hypothetical protein
VSEPNQHSVATVPLTTEEANLLRSARWWESSQLDSGIILAVLTMIDRPDLVCPLEVYQRVLAERLEANVTLEELSTKEGRAKIRQQSLARLERKVQGDLSKWVDVFLEQALANITTVQSKLSLSPPEGGIGWRNLSSEQARNQRRALDPDKFSIDALAAVQLLTNKRIISPKLFQKGLDLVCKSLGIPGVSLFDHGLRETQEGSSGNRIQLAVDVLGAQKPETLLRLRNVFAITAKVSGSVTPRKPPAPSGASLSLPRIQLIRLNADDFVLASDLAQQAVRPVKSEPKGYRVRPLYRLRTERQEQIREIVSHSVIDLTGIPKEWMTSWDRLNCYGITTKGALYLTGENSIRELTAELTLAQILVAPKRFVVSGELVCNAIVSEPVARVSVKNYYPNHQTVTVDSYEEFIPLCTNEPVLSDLLDRDKPLHHSVVGEDLLLIYEAAPAPTSKVTVENRGCLTTQLSVVARIQGQGSSYVRTLAGATRIGKNVRCVECVDKEGRRVQRLFRGQSLVGLEEWHRNVDRGRSMMLIAESGEMAPSVGNNAHNEGRRPKV